MKNKAQGAIEFIILIGAVLFFFVAIISIINLNMSDKYREKEELFVKDIAYAIQDEINLAAKASDGYNRTFSIPSSIAGKPYEDLRVFDNLLQVSTKRVSIALPVPITEANFNKDKFIYEIIKTDGKIYLNPK